MLLHCYPLLNSYKWTSEECSDIMAIGFLPHWNEKEVSQSKHDQYAHILHLLIERVNITGQLRYASQVLGWFWIWHPKFAPLSANKSSVLLLFLNTEQHLIDSYFILRRLTNLLPEPRSEQNITETWFVSQYMVRQYSGKYNSIVPTSTKAKA